VDPSSFAEPFNSMTPRKPLEAAGYPSPPSGRRRSIGWVFLDYRTSRGDKTTSATLRDTEGRRLSICDPPNIGGQAANYRDQVRMLANTSEAQWINTAHWTSTTRARPITIGGPGLRCLAHVDSWVPGRDAH
jgi:hypothetical protein